MTPAQATRRKRRTTCPSQPENWVTPGENEKSGCLWCPLLPWSHDFFVNPEAPEEERECALGEYKRKAATYLKRESESHTVQTRCVQESEWNKVDVLFVGEAPGATEDKKGEPFQGASGKLLRQYTEAFEDSGYSVGIANAVRCRPPRNRNPNKTELQSCVPKLIEEIKVRSPRFLVALGGPALTAITGQTGILSMNQRVVQSILTGFEDLKVVACLHPAYVLRANHEMHLFHDSMEVVEQMLEGTYEPLPGEGEYFTLTDLEDVENLIESLLAVEDPTDPVACDTETGSLSPHDTRWPKLLCFSFSDEEGYGYTVPFDHQDSPWRVGGSKERERDRVAELLVAFFESDAPKDFQNGKFDENHIRAALKCETRNYQDTMLTHLVLDERKGTHGLKDLAHKFTGMGGYEKALEDYIGSHAEANPDKGGSYANIPGDTLFRYAAMDADVTKRVARALRADPEYAENKPLRMIAETFLPSLSVALADMEFQGALIDQDVAAELDDIYTEEMRVKTETLKALENVREYERMRLERGEKDPTFNPGSHKQLREVLFGLYGEMPVEMTDKGLESLSLRWERRVRAWRKAKSNSSKPSFQGVVKRAIRNKEWDHFSTKAEVLQELERKGNEIARVILDYRAAETLHGTFVKPMRTLVDLNGYLHGTYGIPGTVTGRLASYDPNLQNIPNKGGGKIKDAYVSRFGDEGLIGQADYSQIELRVAASWFKEPTMIKAYCDGADIHRLTALDISGLSEDSFNRLSGDDQKQWRTRAKRINFGILYGGGPPALQSTLRKDGVFLSIEECKELIERYFEVRPALKDGIERLEESVCELGYLESFTGRRRRVPEVFNVNREIVSRALRQSVNFPIQNGASEMTLMSLVLIWREMRKRGYRSKLILTVHDSVIFDLHVDEYLEIMRLAKDIMERLPSLSDQVLPGLQWDWLKTPLVADCEVGVTWNKLVGFDPVVLSQEEETDESLWEETEKGWRAVRDPINTDELWEVMDWKSAG